MNHKNVTRLKIGAAFAAIVGGATLMYQDLKNEEFEPTTEAQAAFGRTVVDPVNKFFDDLSKPINDDGPGNRR